MKTSPSTTSVVADIVLLRTTTSTGMFPTAAAALLALALDDGDNGTATGMAVATAANTTTQMFTSPSQQLQLQWNDIVLIAIMAVISIVTVFGNLVVLLSYYLDKNIRQPSNYFIFSWAVSDLIGENFFCILFVHAPPHHSIIHSLSGSKLV